MLQSVLSGSRFWFFGRSPLDLAPVFALQMEVALKKIAFVLLAVLCFPLLAADDEEKDPWKNKAQVSGVWSGGNSESHSFGAGAHFNYKTDDHAWFLKLSGVRAESTSFTRYAVGTVDNYEVVEESETRVTEEKYQMSSRYDHSISERLLWFVGADWERNEFAGIDNRISGSAGLGNAWMDTDTLKFKTHYGLEYTKEDLLTAPPGYDDSFSSFTAGYGLWAKFTKTTLFEQDFKFASNLEESGDFRADLKSALSVTMTDRLALAMSLNIQYDSNPAFEEVSFLDGDETVFFELDEIDTLFQASLVWNF